MRLRQALTALGTLSLFAFAASGCGGEMATGADTLDPTVTPPGDSVDQADASLASLIAAEVPGASVIVVEVTPEEMYAPQAPDDGRLRVGISGAVDLDVDLSTLRPSDLSDTPLNLGHGVIRQGLGDGFVWTGIVQTPDATAMRVYFEGFFLPEDAELYIYSDRDEVAGPYTALGPDGDGEFWSHTLRGSEVTLQLRYTGDNAAKALADARFVVSEIGHLDQNFLYARYGSEREYEREHCKFNEPCVMNADCYGGSVVAAAKEAVAAILFKSGGGWYLCSGGLIADRAGSGIPYFLTANHCLSKDREASTLEAYFDFISTCGDSCNTPFYNTGTPPTTIGASIVATGRAGDFSLLELAEDPERPGLGWDNADITLADGTVLYRISHPSGATQAYSKHSVDSQYIECRSWPIGERIYSQDDIGATEGGSSGSPLLNANGEIVGQLSGGCGYNINDVCDAELNRTVDGALSFYFDQVAQWLDPTGCVPTEDPEVSCDDNIDNDCDGLTDGDDPDCPCVPVDEICDEGIDNVCDDLVDGDDPDCACAPVGADCVYYADCCSNKCKGKPGRKTCK
ncbi:MAG: trypsin-like peptidase domain-containing protein [Deltaproteobacteria bacterium]|nr:trypsin-like peptidase domain-containing protein [Deltaproteobacteria bacterium]